MPPTTVEEIVAAPWWPEMLAQKDSLSWAALTERFGVNATALRRALEAKGHTKAALPPGRKSRAVIPTDEAPAPPDPRELLRREAGKRPDAEVAASVGVTVDEVKAFRREHGIAPYLRPPPAAVLPAPVAVPVPAPPLEPLRAPAGAVLVRRRASPDGETTEQVRRETPAPVVSAAPAVSGPPAVVAHPAVETTPLAVTSPVASPLDGFRDRLGKVGDQVIADLAGVSRGMVGDYRRRHGIPAYQGYKFEPGHAQVGGGSRVRSSEGKPAAQEARPGRRSAIDDHAEVVGKIPDARVAALAGVTPAAVTQYRQRRGIAAFVPEPAPVALPVEADEAASPKASDPVPAERAFVGRASKIDPFADLVGVLSDGDVAERAGVTTQNVRNWRTRRGIPAPAERSVQAAAPVAASTATEVQAQAVEVVAPEPPVLAVPAEAVGAPIRRRNVAHLEPLPALHAYRIVTSDGHTTRKYIVVAADLMDAAERATDALSHRDDGPWRIVLIKELEEALGSGL